jgi:hypothetical protein
LCDADSIQDLQFLLEQRGALTLKSQGEGRNPAKPQFGGDSTAWMENPSAQTAGNNR